ncbi:GHKL domain-containing protein [uncultured Eubacterium sp.]
MQSFSSAFHGWRLHNVAQAVEKYDGALKFNYKDGIFAASAMLFFP